MEPSAAWTLALHRAREAWKFSLGFPLGFSRYLILSKEVEKRASNSCNMIRTSWA
jgi:hypothetical protein